MDSKAEYLPFNAINEFMRPDFRLAIVRETINALPDLSDEQSSRINHLIHKLVKVPGFRNSDKAPAMMKIIPVSKSFEKSPELVAAILAGWAELYTDLRILCFNLLKERGWLTLSDDKPLLKQMVSPDLLKKWPILPPEIDRTKLPGFYIRWPKGQDFETLYNHFNDLHPDVEASIDKVSLMIVWLSMRLPYQMEEIENTSSDEDIQPQVNDNV